uniref:Uncharacterized protein n=1 Tax=Trichogramma kaykai TaxID=54128 RepID=A0ABD2WEA0_9HYME
MVARALAYSSERRDHIAWQCNACNRDESKENICACKKAATEVELDMFRSLYVRYERAYYLFEECKLAFEELRNNFQKQRIHRKVIAKVHMIARCVGYGAIFESIGLLSYPVTYRYVLMFNTRHYPTCYFNYE